MTAGNSLFSYLRLFFSYRFLCVRFQQRNTHFCPNNKFLEQLDNFVSRSGQFSGWDRFLKPDCQGVSSGGRSIDQDRSLG